MKKIYKPIALIIAIVFVLVTIASAFTDPKTGPEQEYLTISPERQEQLLNLQ